MDKESVVSTHEEQKEGEPGSLMGKWMHLVATRLKKSGTQIKYHTRNPKYRCIKEQNRS